MRRLAFLGLVFVAAIVSCAKDLTGPNAARFVRGLSWNPVFPPALLDAGGLSSGVVNFNRVHVVLHHSDETVALDTTIAFPSSADTLLVSLTVALLTDAPASGEPMTINLGYLDAAGDTVFRGGPISITAAPRPPGGGVNPPVQVPVAYTGPGASATAVVIAPRTTTVAAGAPFSFTAIAKDASGDTLAGTPIIWSSLDPTIATITAPAAGTGVAQSVAGTARILAQLLTGAADTVQLIVTIPASVLTKSSGDAQSGTTGVTLAQPLVAKVANGGGVGVAGTTVNFAVVTGGGSVTPTSAVTDANGLATTSWTLGATVGAQSVSATAGALTPVTFTATAASGGSGLRTWTGATSNAWTTASNWSPAVVPGGGDSVFVPVTSTLPTLASATTIKSLTLAPSAVLTFTSATLTLVGSLDATGGIVGTGTVALNSPTGGTVRGTITVPVTMAGLYTATGSLSAIGLTLTNSGSLDINGQTVVTTTGGISTASTATFVMTQAAGILGTTGNASFGGGDETGKLTAGTLSVGGNFTEGGGNAAAFNAGPAHTLILSASAASTLSLAHPTTSLIGNLSIVNAAGVTALTTFSAHDVTLAATGALSGTLGATITGTLTDPSTRWAAGDIVFTTSNTPVSAATTSITPASQVTFSNNPSNLAANLIVNGNVNLLGTLVVGGHTLTINGALATSASGQLTMNNAADIVNVSGNVTFGSTGAGGPMLAGTLNIGGNFLQSGNSQSISTSGTNTIVFNGSGTQTVTFSSPDGNYSSGCVAACFQNLTVNKATGQVNILTAVKVQGNFVNSSTAVIQTPVANGPFIVASNATFGQNGTFFRTGVGGTTFSKGAGTLIDSVSYFGAGQTYNPATLGEVYSDIRGTAQWSAAGTLTGQLVLSGAGALNVSTSHAVVTGNLTSSGTSTLAITTNPLDSLMIGGNATFGGGASTGLLTTGTLAVTGNISVTGAAIDGSGAFTTVLNGTTGTQTMTWTSPVAGKGYNNLTLRGGAQRQFSGAQTVVGNMLIAANSGNVNGSFVLTFGGNITDSTAGRNAWNGSSSVIMTGSPTVLPRNFGVNTLTFSGGTVTLADSLKTGFLVVDGASAHLKLNGHYVGLTANFTTQNGGVLEMTNTRDTLDVQGSATFNGGNTSGLLTHGFINVGSTGFTQGVNATAFVADSTLRVSIGRGNGTTITFANPGFGATLSHFGELMIGDGSTHTLNSDVFVQGQLTTTTGPQFPITSANHLITAQGVNATNLFLTNTRLLLVDGSRVTTMTNVQFLSMSPTVTQFEVQRSGNTNGTGDFPATLSAPLFNTVPTSGLYLKATDTNGAAPFVTINVATPNPASAGTFVTAVSNAVINGWPANATVTATRTGTWSDPTMWSTGVVPTTNDNVVIPGSTFLVNVTSNASAHNLTVTNSSSLTLSGTNTLTVSGTPTNTGTTNCTADNIVVTGTVTLSGSWCGLRTTGTVTLGGSLTVGLLNIAGGTVSNGGTSLNVTTLQTTGSGTLGMLSANANVNVTGNASFNGGVETGLLTSGTLTIGGNFSAGTGAMFDASSAHTTAFAGSASQTIGWTAPAANVGFGAVTFNHSWPRQFTSDVFIGGTVQIFSSDTVSQQSGTAFISGAHRVTLGGTNQGISDGSIGGPAWRVGATNFALPGASLATTVFTNLSGTDTTIFSGGGTVTVPPGSASKFVLLTKNFILDNSTNLNLNGGLLNTQGNSFTTQNGATLTMNAFSNDSLDAGHAYFNGGSTSGTLFGGGMSLTGLYQGFSPTFTPVATASAAAFAPIAGLHTYFKGSAPDTIAFANPDTANTGSHFWFVQNRITSTGSIVLRSDIAVDSIVAGDASTTPWNSDALGTTVRTITTKGLSNSGTFGVTFGAVAIKFVQGGAPSGTIQNFTWNQFPANYTGTVLTQQRTTATTFNLLTYSALTFGATGEFATNLGTAGMTFQTGISNPGCASRTLATNQSCK